MAKKKIQQFVTKTKYLNKSKALGQPMMIVTDIKQKMKQQREKKLTPDILSHKVKPKMRVRKLKQSKQPRRSVIMNGMLHPMMPSLKDTLLATTRKKINNTIVNTRNNKKKLKKQVHRYPESRRSQRKVERVTKLVDASTYKKSPVFYLIKDTPRRCSRRQQLQNQQRQKLLDAPSDWNPGYAKGKSAIYSQYRCHGGYTNASNKPNYVGAPNYSMPSYGQAKAHSMDFFYNMGQRAVMPHPLMFTREQFRADRMSASQTFDDQSNTNKMEVPLSNRLPIIDFISTQEFQNMQMQKKHIKRAF